jgi:GTP cyclohydrolase II
MDPEANMPHGRVKGRLRLIHRAASELRRGVPVVIGGDNPLLVLAAETAGEDGLAELEEISGIHPVLILAPARASAVTRTAVLAGSDEIAVELPASLRRIEVYQALANPMDGQPPVREALRVVPTPPGAGAAISLAKIGRLLPAVLATPIVQNVASALAGRGLTEVQSADVQAYPRDEVTGLKQIVSALVPLTDAAESRVVAFRSDGSAFEHLAIVIGRPETHEAPLVRIHSECFTGDLLGSMRCDCGEQLRGALRRIAEAGAGVLLYLAQEGRGIGLVNKLRAYGLQDRGLDTMDANRALGWNSDERNFLLGATMLHILGISPTRSPRWKPAGSAWRGGSRICSLPTASTTNTSRRRPPVSGICWTNPAHLPPPACFIPSGRHRCEPRPR